MHEDTHPSLLERLRETTEGASWREFIAHYESMIRGWLAAQEVPEQDADDVWQEVLAAVAERIRGFTHGGRAGAFRGWLRGIVAEQLRSYWQTELGSPATYAGPNLSNLADELTDDSTRLSRLWDGEHDRRLLAYLLEQLKGRFPEKSLAAFNDVVILGESPESVAERCDLTINALHIEQHRVLSEMKKLGKGLID